MKNLRIFCIWCLLITSCKAIKWETRLENSLNQENPELDLVFYAVLNAEFKECGTSIAIIDKSIGETSIGLEGHEMELVESENSISWNKDIFPYANFLDGTLIKDLKTNDHKMYMKYIRKYGQNGWLELKKPKFSSDKKYALIEVDFYRGRRFNSPSYYILEKNNHKYEIVKLGSTKSVQFSNSTQK